MVEIAVKCLKNLKLEFFLETVNICLTFNIEF